MSDTDLSRILKRVQTLLSTADNMTEQAERTGVSEADAAAFRHEADARRTMADSLMLQYAIKDAGQAADGTIQSKPMIITVDMGPNSEVISYLAWVMGDLAKHCRCRIRPYAYWADGSWHAKVYGFESDVRYYELVYTTIRLHMMGVLLPRVDRTESLEENCYRLHSSGYNWLQIAELYNWHKYSYTFAGIDGRYPPAEMKVPYYRKTDAGVTFEPATTVGSAYKRAYYRACKEKGEQPQKIAANGTATYRRSAASGYVSMISRRLMIMRHERTAGTELILRSRVDALDLLFREDNPDLFREPEPEEDSNGKKGRKPRAVRYRAMTVNEDAYRRGATHAQGADLSGSSRMGGSRTALQ